MKELLKKFTETTEQKFTEVNKDAQNLINDGSENIEESWGVMFDSEEWLYIYN